MLPNRYHTLFPVVGGAEVGDVRNFKLRDNFESLKVDQGKLRSRGREAPQGIVL